MHRVRLTSRAGLALSALTLAAGALGAGGGAHAATFMDTLTSVAATYNLYTTGNVGTSAQPVASDTEGRIAAGGNAGFSGYSIAQNTPGGVVLTVGKDLSFQNGSIDGSVVVGGNATFHSAGVNGAVAAGGALSVTNSWAPPAAYSGLPIDFAKTSGDLTEASAYLDSAAALKQGVLGTVSSAYGGLTLSSKTGGLVFFDLTASEVAGINDLQFDVNPLATVIVNITGLGDATTGVTMSNFGFDGSLADKTLFNFADATTLNLSGVGFDGSILAPNATFNGANGHINGSVMVDNFTGSIQLNEKAFDGQLPTPAPVPEPGVWAMMIVGLGGIGATIRRRRQPAPRVAA